MRMVLLHFPCGHDGALHPAGVYRIDLFAPKPEAKVPCLLPALQNKARLDAALDAHAQVVCGKPVADKEEFGHLEITAIILCVRWVASLSASTWNLPRVLFQSPTERILRSKRSEEKYLLVCGDLIGTEKITSGAILR